MKTEQLIAALAADEGRAASPLRTMAIAVVIGVLLTAVLFLTAFEVRPDVAWAVRRTDFLFKFVVTLTVAIPALLLLRKWVSPARGGDVLLLAIGPLILATGVLLELWATAPLHWDERMIGSNSLLCLTSIPLLSLAPFIALLCAMRAGAPTRSGLTGAVCGLAAGGIGATFYAAHCTDDSPLFVAVWYSLAIGSMTLIGAIAGRRWLRW